MRHCVAHKENMNRKLPIVILMCLIVAVALVSCTPTTSDSPSQPEQPVGEKSLDDSAISETAKVYSSLAITSCKGKWGSAAYAVEAEITTPSGKTETTKSNYVVTEEGVYNVKLTANVGGEMLTRTKSVSVGGYSAQALFSASNATIVAENISVADKLRTGTANTSGMQVSINQSSTLNYKPVVDLNEVRGNLIEFVPNYLAKSRDLRAVKLVLTDAYDSANKLEVLFQLNTGVGGVPDSKLGQGESQAFISVTFNGVTTAKGNYPGLYDVVVCFNQNFLPYFPFHDGFRPQSNDTVQVRFDNATNKFYTRLSDGDYMLMDVSDPTDEYVDFKGFTTGEVYLSVQGVTGSGDIVLTKLGNTVLSNVDKDDYKNANNVFLTGGFDINNMLVGFVGHPYYIPTGMSGVTAKLFCKGEGETKFVDVSDKLAYGFVPDKAGEYYVRYQVTNNYGYKTNVDTAHFQVYATPKDAGLEIKTTFDGQLSAKLFDLFAVPEIPVVGGSGKLSVDYFVVVDGAETAVRPGQRIPVQNKGQTVAVKVVATDQMSYSEEFVFPVAIDNNVTRFELVGCYDEITVMYGDEITVPAYTAIDYSQDNVSENNLTLDILQGKSKQLNVGDKITVYGEMTIVYLLDGKQKLALDVHCVPETIDTVEGGNTIDKQFGNVAGLGSATAYDEGTFFAFDGSADSVVLPMPYTLSTSNLKFSLGVLDSSAINGVVITLADKRQGYELSIKLTDLAAKPVLWLNGNETTWQVTTVKQTATSGKYAGKSYYMYTFIFDGGLKAVQNAYEMTVGNVDAWSNGVAFDGFDMCGAKVTFTIDNAKGGEVFLLNNVSNQTFTKSAFEFGDRVVPTLAFEGAISSGIVDIGTSVFVPKAYVYDVLSYSSTIKMSVITPSGAYIYQNVAPRACTVDFTEYGRYRVSYTIADNGGKGQSRTYTYIFDCLDKEPPQIMLDGDYDKEYKAGKKITVIGAQATDNTSDVTLTVLLYNQSTMVYTPTKIGDNLKLAAGKYTIVYYATDENGNFATQKFDITVK